MFKSLDLSLIVEFILMFYKDKPIDWLLDHILWVKVCNPEKDAVCKQPLLKGNLLLCGGKCTLVVCLQRIFSVSSGADFAPNRAVPVECAAGCPCRLCKQRPGNSGFCSLQLPEKALFLHLSTNRVFLLQSSRRVAVPHSSVLFFMPVCFSF